jgi:hypothetical protein
MATTTRPAGTKLMNFLQSGLGEELFEGVGPAVLIGGSQLFDENVPTEQALTNTALMATLGTGIGMGGRNAGAYIGRKLYDKPIKNPHLAQLGGSIGQKGMFEGLQQGLAQHVGQMRDIERAQAASRVRRMADADPSALAKHLGIPSDKIDEILPLVRKLDSYIENDLKGIDGMGKGMKKQAEVFRAKDNDGAQHLANGLSSMSDAILSGPREVTGEHLGRAVGRIFGDEIGITSGLALGTVIGDQVGWMSPQQLEIKKLEKKVKELGGNV